MGIRFQRRFALLPGLCLNVSRSGVSTSVGVPGAHVTFGRHGTRTSVGIPGTGLSFYGVTRAIGGTPTVTHTPYDWTLIRVMAVAFIIALVIF